MSKFDLRKFLKESREEETVDEAVAGLTAAAVVAGVYAAMGGASAINKKLKDKDFIEEHPKLEKALKMLQGWKKSDIKETTENNSPTLVKSHGNMRYNIKFNGVVYETEVDDWEETDDHGYELSVSGIATVIAPKNEEEKALEFAIYASEDKMSGDISEIDYIEAFKI